MKRDQIKFLAALTALLLLAGCSGESTGSAGSAGSGDVSPENTHVHAAAERWERDAKEHWHLCGCGEKMDIGEHTLDDMFFCTVCGSEVQDYGDTVDVYTYNEQGDPLQTTSYDADGAVLSDQSWEYEYDENGGKKTERSYNNGVLAEVTEYAPGADGESRTVKYTGYNEDGSYFVNEYDEMGNVTAMYSYDAANVLAYEGLYEYALTADGESYESKTTECSHEQGYTFVCTYNEYEDLVTRAKYGEDEQLEYEERYDRDYNDEGQPLWERVYRNGVLVSEILRYAESENEFGWMRYPEETVDYYEDGSKLVLRYGENGEVSSEIRYTPDGTAEYIHNYVYATDENGNWDFIEIYEWDNLISRTEYDVSADGWSYKSKVTEWNKDGSYKVSEYDENEELVSETAFDAQGKEIPG